MSISIKSSAIFSFIYFNTHAQSHNIKKCELKALVVVLGPFKNTAAFHSVQQIRLIALSAMLRIPWQKPISRSLDVSIGVSSYVL